MPDGVKWFSILFASVAFLGTVGTLGLMAGERGQKIATLEWRMAKVEKSLEDCLSQTARLLNRDKLE